MTPRWRCGVITQKPSLNYSFTTVQNLNDGVTKVAETSTTWPELSERLPAPFGASLWEGRDGCVCVFVHHARVTPKIVRYILCYVYRDLIESYDYPFETMRWGLRSSAFAPNTADLTLPSELGIVLFRILSKRKQIRYQEGSVCPVPKISLPAPLPAPHSKPSQMILLCLYDETSLMPVTITVSSLHNNVHYEYADIMFVSIPSQPPLSSA